MRVLISGATGLIGSALAEALRSDGHQVAALSRSRQAGPGTVAWDPAAGVLDPATIEGFDGVVHLAGESIGSGRWTRSRKEAILTSRVAGTTLLATTLASLSRPPAVLVSASGINLYGRDCGDELLTEKSAPGDGFLAEVCQQWEASTVPAAAVGIRVVLLRTAMVLTAKGGALARMLPLFKSGAGGVLGSGRQWWSWITLDDHVAVIRAALQDPSLRGPVNSASPQPVTNREFTRVLAHVLSRPAVLPAPAFALRLALGELADELLLASLRIHPAALEDAGFAFADAELEPALRHVLNR